MITVFRSSKPRYTPIPVSRYFKLLSRYMSTTNKPRHSSPVASRQIGADSPSTLCWRPVSHCSMPGIFLPHLPFPSPPRPSTSTPHRPEISYRYSSLAAPGRGTCPGWTRLRPGERSGPKIIELTQRLNCLSHQKIISTLIFH